MTAIVESSSNVDNIAGAKKERKTKTMEVIATPTRPRKEIQESTITMIDDSSDEESRVFDLKLTSQTIPTSEQTGKEEAVTSIAVTAPVEKGKAVRPVSATGPVERQNIFDSLSDTDSSTEELQLVAQSTDSLDIMFG